MKMNDAVNVSASSERAATNLPCITSARSAINALDVSLMTNDLLGCTPVGVMESVAGFLVLLDSGLDDKGMPKLFVLTSDCTIWSIDFRFPNDRLTAASDQWVRANAELLTPLA